MAPNAHPRPCLAACRAGAGWTCRQCKGRPLPPGPSPRWPESLWPMSDCTQGWSGCVHLGLIPQAEKLGNTCPCQQPLL